MRSSTWYVKLDQKKTWKKPTCFPINLVSSNSPYTYNNSQNIYRSFSMTSGGGTALGATGSESSSTTTTTSSTDTHQGMSNSQAQNSDHYLSYFNHTDGSSSNSNSASQYAAYGRAMSHYMASDSYINPYIYPNAGSGATGHEDTDSSNPVNASAAALAAYYSSSFGTCGSSGTGSSGSGSGHHSGYYYNNYMPAFYPGSGHSTAGYTGYGSPSATPSSQTNPPQIPKPAGVRSTSHLSPEQCFTASLNSWAWS